MSEDRKFGKAEALPNSPLYNDQNTPFYPLKQEDVR